MPLFNSIYAQLGMMTWPLTVVSLITLMIILERSLFVLLNSRNSTQYFIRKISQISQVNSDDLTLLSTQLSGNKDTFSQGANMLLSHRHFKKSLREESVSLWLQKKRQNYTSGLRVLTIIGVISPLIGLLGTVLGLIDMFKNLGTMNGVIAPAQLADGLGLAMSTTAAGLLVALPAITSAQLFHLWADRALAQIEYGLNHCNLFLEGVTYHANVSKHSVQGASNNNAETPLTTNTATSTSTAATLA
ncbi:MotA/TolQ/ExbB proton channel family protein [Colwellia ponticola]|uniref:MotA/TolQ/ExbB proton channel family protein n=1 Tax=Colwellia ponticola TaxID=2304625 RepID=A0A8H2JLX2_9GAMM|nr:MotA/TolQ/ExbB proton channel family protein [Colwellia ponticola]TMM45243.1 MotA/TolQ/ExbB proton channel family protein [Colwellia ponticola]